MIHHAEHLAAAKPILLDLLDGNSDWSNAGLHTLVRLAMTTAWSGEPAQDSYSHVYVPLLRLAQARAADRRPEVAEAPEATPAAEVAQNNDPAPEDVPQAVEDTLDVEASDNIHVAHDVEQPDEQPADDHEAKHDDDCAPVDDQGGVL